MCHKTKLVRFLLADEPDVSLFVVWTRWSAGRKECCSLKMLYMKQEKLKRH